MLVKGATVSDKKLKAIQSSPKGPNNVLYRIVFNTLRPRQNGRHFPDDIFKCIFLNEHIWITMKFSLKFVPKGPIDNIPALVHLMAWRRPEDKPSSEPTLVIYASLDLNELIVTMLTERPIVGDIDLTISIFNSLVTISLTYHYFIAYQRAKLNRYSVNQVRFQLINCGNIR